MYKLLKQEGSARRAEFTTNRGTVQTPAFMNVATAAAIKGAVSARGLKNSRLPDNAFKYLPFARPPGR